MRVSDAYRVDVHRVPVGLLRGNARGGAEFSLFQSYIEAYPRPILGQTFLDNPRGKFFSRARLPAWFANLLPEGALREFMVARAGDSLLHEFRMLAHLRADLPGAVTLVPAEGAAPLEDSGEDDDSDGRDDVSWHFSLAGVQLKFSARWTERGLTIPGRDQHGGNWIVKLPDARFENVPENEFATMTWAAASGLQVPQIRLVPMGELTRIPMTEMPLRGSTALAILRFDRTGDSEHVHMEDFAQLLDVYPHAKYNMNYETVASFAFALSGEAAVADVVKRLIFMAASGNGDAHLKNWSVIYPDQVSAELSPNYDLVSTIQYQETDEPALNFGGRKRWENFDLRRFASLAKRLGITPTKMEGWVEEAAHNVASSWRSIREQQLYTSDQVVRLDDHMRRVPVLAPHVR
ncbi:type II toxin-antitoxin system HipA family toxin [Achromobacter sp. GG226]|uniref:type II toxin-antitoxin system HipA family toxin n=1 Tax=Verticiella alkaliphila TaxID=2779529 RepID=UPI001C0D3471|nr:type II toxin-antitoxin system HipA family toxin [Verticiella sp. GG226]MBU4610114.1 type II toxin-antitoxin system HipA family toxin [Verticiella sp. GG226]